LHYSRRQIYEETSTHLGVYCRKMGLTPNTLTALSLVCAGISGYFFWQRSLISGIVFMLLTSLTDMLDGATARAGKMGSPFAAFWTMFPTGTVNSSSWPV